ncbi:MAG: hypothetical protein FWD83_06230, partial [Promicromonosporaceae bacterium]|nr:hypothetical protein [Promicromonosporaceae bacterium]
MATQNTVGSPLSLADGATLYLYLEGTSTLVGEQGAAGGNPRRGFAGLQVPLGTSITIDVDADQSGTLNAIGGFFGAGIGGHDRDVPAGITASAGSITINGGTIVANGGQGAAGIGASRGSTFAPSDGGVITINGGNITAIGGRSTNPSNAAGIGGGEHGSGGQINIHGGVIHATGRSGAAGIGGGTGQHGGVITITAGTITAEGGQGGAAIGGGSGGGATITITGEADVTAIARPPGNAQGNISRPQVIGAGALTQAQWNAGEREVTPGDVFVVLPAGNLITSGTWQHGQQAVQHNYVEFSADAGFVTDVTMTVPTPFTGHSVALGNTLATTPVELAIVLSGFADEAAFTFNLPTGWRTVPAPITAAGLMTADAAIHIERVPHPVMVGAATGGSASANPTAAVAGANVVLTAVPADDWRFVRWDVEPAVAWAAGSAAVSSATFVMPGTSVTVTPVFEVIPEVTPSPSPSPSPTVSPTVPPATPTPTPSPSPPVHDWVCPTTAAFVDVPVGSQFHCYIEWLAQTGITTGWVLESHAEFRPMLNIERQAMSAFLYRGLAEEGVFHAPGVPTFVDKSPGDTFFRHVEWMADTGITTGWNVEGGLEYRPLAGVERQAMAAFIYRAAGSPDFTPPATASFRDVPVGAAFFLEIEWMAQTGITVGWQYD